MFLSKLLPVTFFAQQIQKDKTHHSKIQKISELGAYLVLLSEFIPGSLKFRLPSAGLIVVSFPTLSEALRVGTYIENKISSAFQFSWPQMFVVCLSYYTLVEQLYVKYTFAYLTMSFPAPSEAVN